MMGVDGVGDDVECDDGNRSCLCTVVRYRVIILLALHYFTSPIKVMSIFVISISSDSSEKSVGTSTARVILFGTIPTIIPSTAPTVDLPIIHDDTSLIHPLFHPLYPPYHLLLPLYSTLLHSFALIHLTVTLLRDHHHKIHSSSKTSSDSHSGTSSDSSLRHSSSGYVILDSPCDSPTTIFVGPSCKRCSSPTTSVPVASPICEALSPVCIDLLLPHKRIRDSDSVTNFELSSEEVDIDACIAFVDDIAARGTDVRVEMGIATEEEAESSVRGRLRLGLI
uniref:Uncharacterized protein n=1 Tax=Tanacetum cinerariifolium TaxID=118510 RepID=A0A6L2KIK5_TANCI|nr:hypothetical protein [Tanacetum cinerariifolium]